MLAFGAIRSPLAQPRNLVGGHFLSALVGVSCYFLFPGTLWLASCLAVATAIALMHVTKTLHPPGGATALIAVTGGEGIHQLGYLYAFVPCLLGALIMLAIALIVNNIPKAPALSAILVVVGRALRKQGNGAEGAGKPEAAKAGRRRSRYHEGRTLEGRFVWSALFHAFSSMGAGFRALGASLRRMEEKRRTRGSGPGWPFLAQSHTRARGRLTVRNVSYTNSRAAGIPCPPAGFAGGPPPACNVRIPRAAPRRGGEGKTFFLSGWTA